MKQHARGDRMAPLTLEEAKSLRLGMILHHRTLANADGSALRAKVNGQPKVWKRDPNLVRVPAKRGLYEFGYITEETLGDWSLGDGEE